MGDFEESDDEKNSQQRQDEESDVEEELQEKTDTSAIEYRNGKDIQGIAWERLTCSRERYREMRLKQYKNYENLPRSGNEPNKECKEVDRGNTFFEFQFNTRLVKSTIAHFQEWATMLSCSVRQ